MWQLNFAKPLEKHCVGDHIPVRLLAGPGGVPSRFGGAIRSLDHNRGRRWVERRLLNFVH